MFYCDCCRFYKNLINDVVCTFSHYLIESHVNRCFLVMCVCFLNCFHCCKRTLSLVHSRGSTRCVLTRRFANTANYSHTHIYPHTPNRKYPHTHTHYMRLTYTCANTRLLVTFKRFNVVPICMKKKTQTQTYTR